VAVQHWNSAGTATIPEETPPSPDDFLGQPLEKLRN
jgi:hypothetical protein